MTEGDDWEEMMAPMEGVRIVRAPKTSKRSAKLYLAVNPRDENGRQLKSKAIYIDTLYLLDKFREILNNNTFRKILNVIEKVNPSGKYKPKKLKINEM